MPLFVLHLIRSLFRSSPWLGLCLFAVYAQVQYRIPGTWLSFILPSMGIALAILTVIDIVTHIIPVEGRVAATTNTLSRSIQIGIGAVATYGLALCINGALDDSLGVNYRAQVVLLSETNSGSRLALPWTVVRWGPSEQTDRLSLTWGERHRLWGGEIVIMQLRPGFLAMPWIMSIERDEEHYLRELTRTVPRATVAWRHLIYYLLRQNRLDEAQEAARHYLKLYPKGHEQALVVGMALKRAGRYREAIPFLEYVLERHPMYEAYQQLGWTMQQLGEIDRAAQLFEASLPLNPNFWEAYFHLGEVYAGQGKYEDALVMYQKVLNIQPNYREVESAVGELHKRIAALKSLPVEAKSSIPVTYCQPWTARKCWDAHIPSS